VGTFHEAIRLLQSRGSVTVRPGPGGGLSPQRSRRWCGLGNSVRALDADETSVTDAVRIRDVLDGLMIDDALWHASRADFERVREKIKQMSEAVEAQDSVAFVRANWALHAEDRRSHSERDAEVVVPDAARVDRDTHVPSARDHRSADRAGHGPADPTPTPTVPASGATGGRPMVSSCAQTELTTGQPLLDRHRM
jgi:hypothetical protein